MTAGLSSHGFTVEELFAPKARCSYPSKVCNNLRAVKLCGSLHKLCEFHRKKANTNQKRLQQRRRAIRAQMAERATPLIDQNASAITYCQSAPMMQMDIMDIFKTDALTTMTMINDKDAFFSTSIDELSVFEADFLNSLLFGGNLEELQAAPVGFVVSYTVADQVQLQLESFSFELQL